MPTWFSLVGFLLAVTPLVMTPGASFTLVSAKGVSGDRRGAFQIILGTGLGILTHAVLAGLGLAVLVMQSAQAYAVVRLVGTAYLVGLVVWLLAKALLRREPDPTPGRQGRRPRHARNPWPPRTSPTSST
ncbi:LysE family translocator [Tessaracoccus flavus]|uniref:Uncharacterized protein n=1 Tax=Tessaracoccus flavus TaxID=1610493 RepID=A0A1Q2CBG5_9ACTN|nr:LysE family transporter [Tessaracoccus flavus]AQP43446.1 hypothetical protein RPIT_00275 [Tessaracoccus flavus]SDY83620.1 LysE type translocator [Tessaracoccus flavus]